MGVSLHTPSNIIINKQSNSIKDLHYVEIMDLGSTVAGYPKSRVESKGCPIIKKIVITYTVYHTFYVFSCSLNSRFRNTLMLTPDT